MKRLPLFVMLGLLSVNASALELLPDDSLSAAVGQAGLSIDISPINIQANHFRYYDPNGFTGAYLGGPYTSGGSLDVANLDIKLTTSTLFTLDVGSTGSGAAAKSGILLGVGPVSGMSVTTGNISVDNGNECPVVCPSARAATTSSTFADLSLTNISMSRLGLLITPGGHLSNSGVTVTMLNPINLSMNVKMDDLVNSGVVQAGVSVQGLMPTTISADVTNSALVLSYGTTTVDSIALTNVRLGSNLPAYDMGGIYLSNATFGASSISISGH